MKIICTASLLVIFLLTLADCLSGAEDQDNNPPSRLVSPSLRQDQSGHEEVQFSVKYDEDKDETGVVATMTVKDQSGQILKLTVVAIHNGLPGNLGEGVEIRVGAMLKANKGAFDKDTKGWFILDGVRLNAQAESSADGSYVTLPAFPDLSKAYKDGCKIGEACPPDLASIARARVAEVECGKFRFRLTRAQQDALQKIVVYADSRRLPSP